jgi:predicted small lipoprotein YifL
MHPMAARPRCSLLVVLAAVAAVTGCGEAPGPDYRLKTPPAEVGAPPIETPVPSPAPGAKKQPRPTQRQAEHLRPVLAGWAAAVRHGDPDKAARYFAVPALVAQSMTVELQTREQVRRFNDELPCGAKLLEVQHDGRYIVGTFRLTARSGHTCAAAGQLARVAFVIRAHHFTEWRQVPDRPGAPPGPTEPEATPPPAGPGDA